MSVESDDLHNLATGRLARELHPDLTVVVQLRNAAVGRALTSVGVRVIDVAAVTAPSIAESCLLRVMRPLEFAGVPYLVVQASPERQTTLGEGFGDIAPLAVLTSGGQTHVAPGRDVVVGPGDRVVLVGPSAQIDAAGLMPRPAEPRAARASAPREAARRRPSATVAVLRGMDRRLRWALTALAMLMATSVAMVVLGYREPDGTRMSVVDAL